MKRKLTRPSASMRGYCTLGKLVEEGFTAPGAGSDATGGGAISGCFVSRFVWPYVTDVQLPTTNHDPVKATVSTRACAKDFRMDIPPSTTADFQRQELTRKHV